MRSLLFRAATQSMPDFFSQRNLNVTRGGLVAEVTTEGAANMVCFEDICA